MICAAGVLAAAPAWAQLSASEQRIQNSLQGIEQYQVQQRLNQVESDLFQLEQDIKTRENLQTLREQAARAPVIDPDQKLPVPPPRSTIEVETEKARQEQVLQESNRRLREIAEELRTGGA
jgi:hypothetical protein